MATRRLAGPGQLTAAAVTKYTVPTGMKTLLRHIHVINNSASSVNFTMSIGADVAGTRIFDLEPIPAFTAKDFWGYYVLVAAEIVQAFGSTTLVLNLELGGDEEAA